jgi:hypothetical protein
VQVISNPQTISAGDLITMPKQDIDFLWLWNTTQTPQTCHPIFVSATRKFTERIMVCEHRGRLDKGHKSTEKGMEKHFPEMLKKNFINIAESVSLPKGTTSEETLFK